MDSQAETKIETLMLDDGRRAERHITVDADGNEVIEIFAEEKRPLKLEKRILREMKNVVSKEVHETIQDGEVAYQEVRTLEQDVPLQVRERVGIADHAKVVDGDYVRKADIGKMIEDGVVAGVSALMENMEPMTSQSVPSFKAQAIVEQHVEEKKKGEVSVIVILGVVAIVQLCLFLGYMYLM